MVHRQFNEKSHSPVKTATDKSKKKRRELFKIIPQHSEDPIDRVSMNELFDSTKREKLLPEDQFQNRFKNQTTGKQKRPAFVRDNTESRSDIEESKTQKQVKLIDRNADAERLQQMLAIPPSNRTIVQDNYSMLLGNAQKQSKPSMVPKNVKPKVKRAPGV